MPDFGDPELETSLGLDSRLHGNDGDTKNHTFKIVCLFIAFPYKVWKVKHNAHHAHTNEEGGDPDLEVSISFTEDMANRNTSAVRFMRKYQAWLFFPLGALVSYTMRIWTYYFLCLAR